MRGRSKPAAPAAVLLLSCLLACNSDSPFGVRNPVPQLDRISPDTMQAPHTPIQISIDGSDFLNGATMRWNGSDRTAIFVSSTRVVGQLVRGDLDTPDSVRVTLVNPPPGGGESNVKWFVVTGTFPVAVIDSIEPPMVLPTAGPVTLVVHGRNFANRSILLWNGERRAPRFESATRLSYEIPAVDRDSSATVQVQIVNPSPGGGGSNLVFLQVLTTIPVPVLESVSPALAPTGGQTAAGLELTIDGRGFVPVSRIVVRDVSMPTFFFSSFRLRTVVPIGFVTTPGVYPVKVVSPGPGGGTSVSQNVTLENPAPQITDLIPGAVRKGAGPVDLVVHGAGLTFGSTVLVRGQMRTTEFVNSTRLHVALSAADVDAPAPLVVEVRNPAPGGGTSNPRALAVFTRTALVANSLVHDPHRNRLYCTVPGSVVAAGNSVTSLDPESGAILSSHPVGSNPTALALSDDGQYLYVGLRGRGSVARVVVATMAVDQEMSLGAEFFALRTAQDLAVVRGSASAVVVAREAGGNPAGMVVFDNGIERASTGSYVSATSLAAGATANRIYAYNGFSTEFGLRRYEIGGSTLNELSAVNGIITGFSTEILFQDGLLYASSGEVVDPEAGRRVGVFAATGPVCVIPGNDGAFFVTKERDSATGRLRAFDRTTFALRSDFDLGELDGAPRDLVAVGAGRVAFRTLNTSGSMPVGSVFIVQHPDFDVRSP